MGIFKGAFLTRAVFHKNLIKGIFNFLTKKRISLKIICSKKSIFKNCINVESIFLNIT